MNRPSPPVSTSRLLAGVLGPAVAWALHIGLLYPLVLLACRLGTEAVLHGVTVVTAALALAFGASSFLVLRRLPAASDEPLSQQRFLARTGVLASALFFVVIVIEGLPVLFHDPCA